MFSTCCRSGYRVLNLKFQFRIGRFLESDNCVGTVPTTGTKGARQRGDRRQVSVYRRKISEWISGTSYWI